MPNAYPTPSWDEGELAPTGWYSTSGSFAYTSSGTGGRYTGPIGVQLPNGQVALIYADQIEWSDVERIMGTKVRCNGCKYSVGKPLRTRDTGAIWCVCKERPNDVIHPEDMTRNYCQIREANAERVKERNIEPSVVERVFRNPVQRRA